jgi:hypothetical protein
MSQSCIANLVTPSVACLFHDRAMLGGSPVPSQLRATFRQSSLTSTVRPPKYRSSIHAALTRIKHSKLVNASCSKHFVGLFFRQYRNPVERNLDRSTPALAAVYATRVIYSTLRIICAATPKKPGAVCHLTSSDQSGGCTLVD